RMTPAERARDRRGGERTVQLEAAVDRGIGVVLDRLEPAVWLDEAVDATHRGVTAYSVHRDDRFEVLGDADRAPQRLVSRETIDGDPQRRGDRLRRSTDRRVRGRGQETRTQDA